MNIADFSFEGKILGYSSQEISFSPKKKTTIIQQSQPHKAQVISKGDHLAFLIKKRSRAKFQYIRVSSAALENPNGVSGKLQN